jgi:hypothetical protein
MNCRNSRYRYELARTGDSEEILQILEETDFKGQFSLAYTRRPDPCASFAREGMEPILLVCRDLEKQRLAGMGAYTTHQLYVNGKPEQVGYLFGLRVRQEYRKAAPLIPQGYREIKELIRGRGIRYHFTTILEENLAAQKLLEKRRAFMPDYIPLARYGTFVFKAEGKKTAETCDGYRLKQASVEEVPDLLGFLNTQGRELQFFPVLEERSLLGAFPGFDFNQFRILYDRHHRIAACGGIWNQHQYKQYLIKEYGRPLKYLYPLAGVLRVFGYPVLPKPGTVLNFAALSFWAVRDHDPEVFRIFIKLLRESLCGTGFFVLGASVEHPLMPVVQRISKLSYWSKAYLVDWEKDGRTAVLERHFPLYLECGFL